MSDTGLHANFHEQVRDYAQRLDELLLQFTSPSGTIAAELTRQVAALVDQLRAPSKAQGLAMQLLAFQAHRRHLFSERHWAEIAAGLQSSSATPRLLDRLETLACFLEEQRTGAVAKMRGR